MRTFIDRFLVAMILLVTPAGCGPSEPSKPGAHGDAGASDSVASSASPDAAQHALWRYSESFDEMRRKSTYFACIASDNQLQFRFPYNGGASGELCFRNSPQFGRDVYLTMDKGQFNCSFMGCTVHLKFDDGKIQAFGAVEASGGNTNALFIHGYPRLKTLMRKSKRLIVEAEYFQEGMQQLTFSVADFAWDH